MQVDPALGGAFKPEFWRDWRDWIGASMQALASGSGVLPPRPSDQDDAALGRIARQIELMAGTVQRAVA